MSDCILWQGRLSSAGYGAIGRAGLAHRVAWETSYGPIPEGFVVHHECRVRRCVNVEHLVCLTHQEHNAIHDNAASWHERQRAKTHCAHGHEYTPENTMVKRGRRHCRECNRAYFRDWYARRKAAA